MHTYRYSTQQQPHRTKTLPHLTQFHLPSRSLLPARAEQCFEQHIWKWINMLSQLSPNICHENPGTEFQTSSTAIVIEIVIYLSMLRISIQPCLQHSQARVNTHMPAAQIWREQSPNVSRVSIRGSLIIASSVHNYKYVKICIGCQRPETQATHRLNSW
jgi:hypothetical protein